MTALPQGRGLAPTHLKTSSTIHSSRLEAVRSDGEGLPSSRSQSRTRTSRSRQDMNPAESLSEAATLSLIRRVLAPDQSQNKHHRDTPRPIEDVLPPLTSSNEVDIQLYAIVAIILKEFVNTWYTKITPDYTFNEEVIQIIAHCSRALEQRIRRLDLLELLLDDLAALVSQHIQAYRCAKAQTEQYSYAASLRKIYHSINQHPALEPVPDAQTANVKEEQAQNEAAYRQLLVQGTLAALLPTDDLRNDSLRVLLSDILADLVIGQALAGKVCESWFLHDIIIKAIAISEPPMKDSTTEAELEIYNKNRLEHFGLLSRKGAPKTTTTKGRRRSPISTLFWHVLQLIYSFALFVRFVSHGLHRAWHSSEKFQRHSKSSENHTEKKLSTDLHELGTQHQPVVSLKVFGTLARLIRLDSRMPWVGSTLSLLRHLLLHWPGQVASYNSVLDRFLHESLTTILLSPKILPQILLSFRAAVFPNNSLGPPAPPPPSQEEQRLLRKKAAGSIVSLIPSFIVKTYYNTSDEDETTEQVANDLLDCFGDPYLNKHLIYGALELLLVRIVPELEDHSVSELLVDRGVDWPDENVDISIVAEVEIKNVEE